MTTAVGRKVRESFSRLPGHLIRRAHQISTAYFLEACGGDLTAVQYAALVTIGAPPGIDATRLSEIIYFDRSTIGDVLDRMVFLGLGNNLITHGSRSSSPHSTGFLSSVLST